MILQTSRKIIDLGLLHGFQIVIDNLKKAQSILFSVFDFHFVYAKAKVAVILVILVILIN